VKITWKVDSSNPNTKFTAEVTEDEANELFVAGDEEAESLTITASAEGHENSVTIAVQDQGNRGRVDINLTITDKGEGLGITGWVPENKPVIYKTGSVSNEVIFKPTGASTYTWYVDGEKQTETGDITFNAADYAVGYHSVRLSVTIDGKPWSLDTELGFTVRAGN